MLKPFFALCVLCAGMMVLGNGAVSGQTTSTGSGQAYPSKPIRIVTAEAGGGTDFVSRLIAQGISAPLGQPVIIDNRPSGVIPGETIAKAPADGYSLLLLGVILWIGPLLQKTPYDPVSDFSPITFAVTQPNVLVVHPSLAVKSVKELIALAKARPGELNYASNATGSTQHLAAELFNAMAGVNIVRINYKGGGPALSGLITGEVQLMFASAASATPHVKAGRLKALAVTSLQPSALAPGLPTVAATGLSGYESASTYGIFAPAKTPVRIINRLNQEIVRFLKAPEAKEQLLNAGVEAVGSSPEELAATMRSDINRLGKVIRDAGIRAE